MTGPKQRTPLQELTIEVLDLLIAYWFFKRRSESHMTKNPTGIKALEHIVLLQAVTQDIVLRLGKLGDEDKHTWNFGQVMKDIKKHGPVSIVPADIESKIGDYKREIKDIKRHHRNAYMAHITKTKPRPFKPLVNLREAVQLAMQICDDLHGERVEYKIGSDWAGVEIDLRQL